MQSSVQLTRWPNALARQKKEHTRKIEGGGSARGRDPLAARPWALTRLKWPISCTQPAGLGDRLVHVGGSTVHRGESGLSADKIEIRVR